MSETIGIGIDPDLHHVGVGVVSLTEILEVREVKVSGNLKGSDAVAVMCATLANGALDDLFRTYPISCVVVEGQKVYDRKRRGKNVKHADPKDLINLAQVAGACLASAWAGAELAGRVLDVFEIPLPSEWKKGVPKSIHQARTLDRYGGRSRWSWDVPRSKSDGLSVTSNPLHLGRHTKTAWKHILDGIGLARWGVLRASGAHGP